MKATIAALSCTLAVCVAQAQAVYKWVDPNGRVHFSDTPQPGWKRIDLNQAGPAAATPTDATAGVDDGAGSDESTPADAADVADNGTRDQLRAEECKRAKEQLASYKQATRIVERDEQGKEKEYSSAERLRLLEQTQKRVNEMCGPAPR
ncbi:DUF4124 domain-containing protein [Fontimonas sp. SYSU GA230001]|uniref:DUF4124 domain-containing protein n=1 Tax=Fontimonas sp. SYSU GA230001 TaxID=3142450 RepID=UPI0032B5E661